MAERTEIEQMDPTEQAADFLRRSLVHHVHTSKFIGPLRATDPIFQERFTQASTPHEVLMAVSDSGSEEAIKVVEDFVDRWVNYGNNKNTTKTRQLIASAHESWVMSRDEN